MIKFMETYEPTYTETPQQEQARLTNFKYYAPFGDQAVRYALIRGAGDALAGILNTKCPPSRELSLAMTKLEECVFWAIAAIARNERLAPPHTEKSNDAR